MTEIRFEDGAGYERFMGAWSRQVGDVFLDWVAPTAGMRWLDVGCGNGAFTERVLTRCAPSAVSGIDPSPAQLEYARARTVDAFADFQIGDAMALPFPDDHFHAAVMSLVLFFVPDPALGVAEMARVVSPGGLVLAYAWDLDGGGFPYATLHDEMCALGMSVLTPPNPQVSGREVLHALWHDAGLEDIATREIIVQRTFADFDDYWTTVQSGPSVRATLSSLPSADTSVLAARMRARLPTDIDGRITLSARAHAVRGRVIDTRRQS